MEFRVLERKEVSIASRIFDWPKPVPYHRVKRTLASEGYNWNSISTVLSDQASNTVSGQSVCKGRFYIMDGMLNDAHPDYDIKTNPSCANRIVTRKQGLNGKYLLVMPCTGTAIDGDYFLAKTWQAASLYFPERMATLDFAATDSIISVADDGKGLLVFENEMERVKGYDLFPSYNEKKLEACKRLALMTLPRLESYKAVILLLNVRLYREAMESIRQPNFHFVDVGFSQGYFLQGLQGAREMFEAVAEKEDIL